MLNLLLQELRVRRGAFAGWAVALTFFSNVYILMYPSLPVEVREIDVRALALLESLGIKTLATFEGWIAGTEFNILPMVAGLFGVFMGIGTLIGEEEEGTLELLATLPLSRLQLLLAKAGALFVAALALFALDGLVVMAVFRALAIDTPVTALDLYRVIVCHWLMAFVFMAASLFLGAYLPTRSTALAAAMMYLLISFFGNNLAGLAPVLDPYQPFFPFWYFERVTAMLTGDVAWGDIGGLLGMGTGFLLLAALAFQRRNLTVGAWPWVRARIKPDV
jgi:ABC-2 type transport system permease protein